MSLRRVFEKIFYLYMFLFAAYISFLPDPVQQRYSGLLTLSLIIMLFSAVIKRGHGQFGRYFFQREDIGVWVYFTLVFITIWFAQDRGLAFPFYLKMAASALPLYFLVKNEITPRNLSKIIYSLFLCAGAVSLIAVLECLFKYNIIYAEFIENYFYPRFINQGRAMSTLVHPNVLGAYLVAMVPFGYFFRKYASGPKRIINHTIFCLICAALFLTFSRGAWIGCIGMIIIWQVIKKNYRGAGVTVIVILSLVLFCNWDIFRGTSAYERFGVNQILYYIRNSHRALAYLVSWDMFSAHPLTGIGLLNYRANFRLFCPAPISNEVMIPDSVFLMHLAETGILGMGSFLTLLFMSYKSFQNIRRQYSASEIGLASLLAWIGLLLAMGTFDGFLWSVSFYLFWVLTAAGNIKARNEA